MRSIKWALASALVVFAAMPPMLALAQSNGVPRDISATAGALAPPEIEAEVRRGGFEPLSRPPPPGRGYLPFALHPYDKDVEPALPARRGPGVVGAGLSGP